MTSKPETMELVETDKLQLFFLKVRGLVEQYRKHIYVASGVFLLLVLSSGGWFLYSLHYETSAFRIYNRIILENASKPESQRADASLLQGYKDLIAKYPNSDAALLAHYRLGNAHFLRQEYDAAVASYQEYLRKADQRSDLITLAYDGLGACHEAKKDFNKALEYYENALKTKSAPSFEALNYTNIARIYEAMNNAAKAVEYYKKAQGKTADPLLTIYIKRKIAILG
jgi:tetratricopeptide (TPR) repeat protein